MIPLLLRRRGSVSEALAVIAFTASSAILATVVGGVVAFAHRAHLLPGDTPLPDGAGLSDEQQLAASLVVCAVVAGALLVPSAVSLGASAAKLSLVRRARSLATIRLVGGTTGQVGSIAVLDVAVQALVGAVLGIGVHLAVTPVLTRLDFGMTPFTASELMLPVWAYPVLVLVLVALAAVSGAISLVGVAISPLGVARESRTVRVSLLRGGLWVLMLVAFVVVSRMSFHDTGVAMAVIAVFMMIVVAGVDVVGPLVVWLAAKAVGATAPWPSWLVGARRLAADPKSGWRTVSGITFGLVVAGMLTLLAVVGDSSGDADQFASALMTGGYLTLGIATVLAAVSTGVTQAARVIDQADTYRAQHIGGATVAQLHRARAAEVVLPAALSSIVATISALVLLSPVLGSMSTSVMPVVLYVAAAICAYALVGVAVAASAPLVRRAALSAR